jgi:hypothetical protein
MQIDQELPRNLQLGLRGKAPREQHERAQQADRPGIGDQFHSHPLGVDRQRLHRRHSHSERYNSPVSGGAPHVFLRFVKE